MNGDHLSLRPAATMATAETFLAALQQHAADHDIALEEVNPDNE
jgi:hypothetical protein